MNFTTSLLESVTGVFSGEDDKTLSCYREPAIVITCPGFFYGIFITTINLTSRSLSKRNMNF